MSQTNSLGQDLVPERTVFLLCDLQEKFREHIHGMHAVIEAARRLVESCRLLSIPLLVSEQYPKGLGSTVSELDVSHATVRCEKTEFSMFVPDIEVALLNTDPARIVLFGLETHVCVQQTALDLLSRNFQVYVVADACGSRSPVDRHFALERLRQAGCIVTTCESVLLQLIRGKEHPQFKAIQSLIKEPLPLDRSLLFANKL